MLRIPNPWEVGFQHASTEWVQRDRSFQSQSARSTCLLRSWLRVAFTLRRPEPSWGCAASASRIGESLNKLQLFETVPPDGFTEGVEQALLHPSEVNSAKLSATSWTSRCAAARACRIQEPLGARLLALSPIRYRRHILVHKHFFGWCVHRPVPDDTNLVLRDQLARLRLPILLVSGYTELGGVDAELSRLTKTFCKDELAATLTSLLH